MVRVTCRETELKQPAALVPGTWCRAMHVLRTHLADHTIVITLLAVQSGPQIGSLESLTLVKCASCTSEQHEVHEGNWPYNALHRSRKTVVSWISAATVYWANVMVYTK